MGPEIETFFGPEMATSAASAVWAQKSRDSSELTSELQHKHTVEFILGEGGGERYVMNSERTAEQNNLEIDSNL